MMVKHPHDNDANLRAYLDQTLPDHKRRQVEQHLANSAGVRATLTTMQRDMETAQNALDMLAPAASQQSFAPQALNRLRTHLADGGTFTNPKSVIKKIERIKFMFSKSFIKRYKFAFTAVALMAIFALAFSFAPIRALAGDFLKIFRVQEVKILPVDAGHLEKMKEDEELSGLLDQFSPEREVLVDGGEIQEMATLNEAAALVDFPVLEITDIPADAGPISRLGVLNESIYQVHLDPALMKAIFEAAEIEVDIPASLNETPILVTRPAMVIQEWGEPDQGLGFAQLRSPKIEYPDDLNLNELGVAVLQLLGRSKAEAMALGATIDWANTLLLPIPSDAEVEVTEVSLHGVKGLAFNDTSPEHDGPERGLVWQKDDLTYLLSGPYAIEQLLEIAQSIR